MVMPNLSPVKNRKAYELLDNKICTGEEAGRNAEECLSRRVESVGNHLVSDAAMQWNECCSQRMARTGALQSSELHKEKEKKYEIHISGNYQKAGQRNMESMAFRIWPAVRQWGILWMMPLKKSMQQSMTGSVWNLSEDEATFRLYPTWMTWTPSRATWTKNICVNIAVVLMEWNELEVVIICTKKITEIGKKASISVKKCQNPLWLVTPDL